MINKLARQQKKQDRKEFERYEAEILALENANKQPTKIHCSPSKKPTQSDKNQGSLLGDVNDTSIDYSLDGTTSFQDEDLYDTPAKLVMKGRRLQSEGQESHVMQVSLFTLPNSGTSHLTKSIGKSKKGITDYGSFYVTDDFKHLDGKVYKQVHLDKVAKSIRKDMNRYDLLQNFPANIYKDDKFCTISKGSSVTSYNSSTARTDLTRGIYAARELALLQYKKDKGFSVEQALSRFNRKTFDVYQMITLTQPDVDMSLPDMEKLLCEFKENFHKVLPTKYKAYSDLLSGVIEWGYKGRRIHAHLVFFCPGLANDKELLHKLVKKSWKVGISGIGSKKALHNDDYGIERLTNYFLKKNELKKGDLTGKTARQVKVSPRVKAVVAKYTIKAEIPLSSETNSQAVGMLVNLSGHEYTEIKVKKLSKGIDSFTATVSGVKDYEPNIEQAMFNNLRGKNSVKPIINVAETANDSTKRSNYEAKIRNTSSYDEWLYNNILNQAPPSKSTKPLAKETKRHYRFALDEDIAPKEEDYSDWAIPPTIVQGKWVKTRYSDEYYTSDSNSS